MVNEKQLDVLNIVAADYEIQIDVFPGFVQIPDEIAILFDDEYRNLQRKSSGLDSHQLELLSAIDKIFESISGKPKYWDLEALRHDENWKKVRVLARKVISSMGEIPSRPKMNWLSYEQG